MEFPVKMGQRILHLKRPHGLDTNAIVTAIHYRDGDLTKVEIALRDGTKETLKASEFHAWSFRNGGYWICGL